MENWNDEGTIKAVQTQYGKTSLWERLTTKKISIDKLVGNPKDEFMNPKIGPSETALSKHINYIKQNGKIDEPVLVKKLTDGTYEIQNGHHRWLAAQKMGLKDVPVEVMK
jgi:ParB-like chromosome segregation protein Spo0J